MLLLSSSLEKNFRRLCLYQQYIHNTYKIKDKSPLSLLKTGLIAISLAIIPQIAIAISADEAVRKIQQIDPAAAIILADGLEDSSNADAIISLNANSLYVPASVVKIPLVLAAYDILGEDFRFYTNFYLSDDNDLIIQGRGDPFLTSEEIRLISSRLRDLGYRRFNSIRLEDSLFSNVEIEGLGDSDNPYDARFSSLLVNFNTLNLRKSVREEGSSELMVVSAEEQTPSLPLMSELGQAIECCKASRINLRGSEDYRRRYVVELFTAIMKEFSIDITNQYTNAQELVYPQNQARHLDEDMLIYRHYNSNSLADVSTKLLLFSNNLISNALLLQFAPDARNPLAASLGLWQESLDNRLNDQFNNNRERNNRPLVLAEGSGLSRDNRASATYFHGLLGEFASYSKLLPQGGSYYGEDVLYKTGTLTGVYNIAGYLQTNDDIRPFVIFTANESDNRREILGILKSVE